MSHNKNKSLERAFKALIILTNLTYYYYYKGMYILYSVYMQQALSLLKNLK